MLDLYDVDAQERANKAALLLVHDRYTQRFAKFVKNAARLAYVEHDLALLIQAAVDETGADYDFVKARFDSFLAESLPVLDTTPPREDLNYKTEDEGLPPERNETGDPVDVAETDVQDQGEVPEAGREETVNRPTKVELDQYTENDVKGDGERESKFAYGNIADESTWLGCVRCSTKLNPVYAQSSPVCQQCTSELKKNADDRLPYEQLQNEPQDFAPIADPNAMEYRCTICNQTGTQDEVTAHVQNDHADVLQRKQQELLGQPTPEQPTAKVADVPDGNTPPPDGPARAEPLPSTPADKFDDMIQDLADRAAARQFSAPSEEEIHSIASQLGVDADQVRTQLYSIATFGNYTGINGDLGDSQVPDGFEEVSVQGAGGRVDSHEALVPVDLVVNKVADSMNMEPNLVYQQVRDKYGDDLPDKYHASVSGEHHFYLPTELAGNQQQVPQQEPAAPPAPEVAPTAPPTQ
jgi:hypothetical protein